MSIYRDILANKPKPDFPTLKSVMKHHGFKYGTYIGVFGTLSEAQIAGADVIEVTYDHEAYDKKKTEYYEWEKSFLIEWREALRKLTQN